MSGLAEILRTLEFDVSGSDQKANDITERLESLGASNFELSFMYRHDSSVVDPNHPLPQTLLAAAGQAGHPLAVSAMTASCDAWFYNNQLGIPTVVYGPGSLKVAHSKDEQLAWDEMALAAETLTRFLMDYCGTQS